MNDHKKILLFADWYEPGYKAGGPIRSCVNFAHYMQERYQVYVFTSDRDLGSAEAYEGIEADKWINGGAQISVYYCSPGNCTWGNIKRQLATVQPDFIYLNSMFSTKFSIFPLLIQRAYGFTGKIFLSPRGMLRSSALAFKSFKKIFFLKSFRRLGLHRQVHFMASDATELEDVKKYFGAGARVSVVPNFPAAVGEDKPGLIKRTGELSMVFVGRLHPVKNLDFLLRLLGNVQEKVSLTVVGSMEDKGFWEVCQQIIARLPANISVSYAGEIPNNELPFITEKHHIFTLPTKGENFGHAIFEALALGKPVLISDQTPWRNLTAPKAGWDLPLEDPDSFAKAISQAAAFTQEEYDHWSASTRRFVKEYVAKLDLGQEYQKLFS